MSHEITFANMQYTLNKRKREREALERAERYFMADAGDIYADKKLTVRERALMHLALRCYTFPEETEIAIINLETRGENRGV